MFFKKVLIMAGIMFGMATGGITADNVRFDWSGVIKPVSVDKSIPVVGGGKSLELRVERAEIRAGERWAEFFAGIMSDTVPDRTELKVYVYSVPGGDSPLTVAESVFSAPECRVLVDMRSLEIEQARVRVELLAENKILDAAEFFISAATCDQPFREGDKIEINLSFPAGRESETDQPVTFGVPFAQGALWDIEKLRLVDDSGSELPAQAEVVALWAPEGSVKWVRFDALVSPGRGCLVEAAEPSGKLPSKPVQVDESDGGLNVSIGDVRYELSDRISPVGKILRDGSLVASGIEGRGLFVVDQHGRLARMGPADVQVESSGPVSACVRFEGDYLTEDGARLARHITRLEFFAGRASVKATHTLVVTENSNEVWFREVGWEMNAVTGADPQAVFGVSRVDPGKSVKTPLTSGDSAYILEAHHRGIREKKDPLSVGLDALTPDNDSGNAVFELEEAGAKTNNFAVHLESEPFPVAEGREMGDWGAIIGDSAGLVFVCRDAALRHPTEIKASHDGRLVLKMFSSRAGEELDFRAETLVHKWGLAEKMSPEEVAVISRHTSNAAGWSKTHELWLVPVPGSGSGMDPVLQSGALSAGEVFALADSRWIYKSNVMGPIYPRDTERFPLEERIIDACMKRYVEMVPGRRYTGFMDYYAGPHYYHSGRYRLPYTLLHDAWLVYARGGDRDVREFAQGANRAYMDNYIAHWDAPRKNRGLFVTAGGGRESTLKSNFPFYWEENTDFNMATSVNMNQFAWDYYLTGNRRAKDIIEQYGEAVKAHWIPEESRSWRILLTMRMILQSYAFTWDPVLRALVDQTALKRIYDPEGALYLSKDRPYESSTYKMETDVDALIEAWEILGTRHYRKMAEKTAEYLWNSVGIDGRSSGLTAVFLYNLTGCPSIAAGVDYYMRAIDEIYDEESGTLTGVGFSDLARILQGLPYSMDIIARSGADKKTPASWIAFDSYGYDTDVFVKKESLQTVRLLLRMPGGMSEFGKRFQLVADGEIGNTPWGMQLHEIRYISGWEGRGPSFARIPRDAPAGSYRITPAISGGNFILSDSRVPMVFYVPDYWLPATLNPPARIYFNIPEGTENPKIFFENTAVVFQPGGAVFAEGSVLSGWIDLPDDTPGLWSFEPVDSGLVRGANFPPFYAMNDPEFYFEPDVVVEIPGAPPAAAKEQISHGRLFVPGVSGAEDDYALYIDKNSSFVLEPGEKCPDGDGGRFLPQRQGTIEFFFRPDWSTFCLKDGMNSVVKSLVTIPTDQNRWFLAYRLDPAGTTINLGPRAPSHSLYAFMHAADSSGRSVGELRCWLLRTIFDAGQWVHIAWVWGEREIRDAHGRPVTAMAHSVYFNGRLGRFQGRSGSQPLGIPQRLVMPGLEGAVDQLRISDVQRYTTDFTPPERDREFELDEHTRALFLFNEELDGKSWNYEGPLSAGIKENK